MTYEDRCPECKNTNGEHKPFCTRWTDEARLFGLRQCDFDDLTPGAVISRAGAVYGFNGADTLRHVPADYVGLSNERLAKAIVDSIEKSLDSVDQRNGEKWTPYDELSDVIDTIIDGPREPAVKCTAVDTWPAPLVIPTFEGAVEDDGFVTVYMSQKSYYINQKS